MFSKDKAISLNQSPYSPHTIIPKLIPANSYVLDVGCNAGYIGKYLKEDKGCTCDGIDIDEFLLTQAKPYYCNLFKIDLYYDNFLLTKKYDIILFIDILEHLPNPYRIIQKFSSNLNPHGRIIICLPNIARIEYRLKHLLGIFDYEESGIMHQDHLRFFTLKSGEKLIQNCGLKIEKILPTGLGARVKVFESLTAFQFIYICKL